MALNIGDNFSYLGAKPLDARRVFASKAALDAVNLSTVYEGMIAYTQLEDKYYRLKSGVWVEFQSGSGITDWVASTSYSVGQYVNYSGSLYKCTTANNDATFTASHWQQISGGADIANWASNTSYVVGTLVIYNDKIYECTTAHTSSTTFDANKWKEISASAGGIANWATNKSYSVGDLVINSNKIYQCNTAHTSGSTFSADASKWTEISASTGGIDNWATSKSYVAGDVVYHNESIFVCNTAHTSSTFSTDASNWTLMYADVKQWKQNTYYVVDTVLIYDGELYKCKTAHDSGSAFTSANFDKIYSDPKEMTAAEVAAMIANFNPSGDGLMLMPNWEANHGYVVMQCVYYSGDMYRCKTAHTSGSTFDSTEEAYWDKIVGGGGTSIANWVSGTNYAVGDFILYNNYIYKCSTANADTSFTPSKWQKLCEVPVWGSGIVYGVGDIVIESNMLYRCITQHTSGSSFNTTEQANWSRLYKDFTGATSLADGKAGLVPKPVKGDEVNFLCGNGTWKSIPYSGSGLIVQDNILWSGLFSSASSGSTLTLNDNFSNYDVILIVLNGQMITTLDPSYGSAFSVVTDGGSLGSTFSSEIVLTFNGTTATANFWNYGSAVASSSILIIGRNYVNPNDFSTTERRIGTWIDGSTLYQITYTATSPSAINTSSDVVTLASNIHIKSIDAIMDTTSGTLLLLNHYVSATDFASVWRTSVTGNLRMSVGSTSYTSQPVYITIRYTKS